VAEEILDVLGAVHRQRPGAWLPLNEIADYITDRAGHRAVRAAAARLANARDIEEIQIAFDQRRVLCARLRHDDAVDARAVEATVNAALAAVGHRVTISPARLVRRHFTPVDVEHRGHAYRAYQRSRAHIVALDQI
jgi:hypothetical protein